MIKEDSAAYLFDEFIKAPNSASCKQLLVATVSLVQSVDDFRSLGNLIYCSMTIKPVDLM